MPETLSNDELSLTTRASKIEQVLSLLRQPGGATIDQLVAATSWLPHTTRAALTGLRKQGHEIASTKTKGETRVYRLVETLSAGVDA